MSNSPKFYILKPLCVGFENYTPAGGDRSMNGLKLRFLKMSKFFSLRTKILNQQNNLNRKTLQTADFRSEN